MDTDTTTASHTDDLTQLTPEEEAELNELNKMLPIIEDYLENTVKPAMATYADSVDKATSELETEITAIDAEAEQILADARAQIEHDSQEEALQTLHEA